MDNFDNLCVSEVIPELTEADMVEGATGYTWNHDVQVWEPIFADQGDHNASS